MSATFTSGEEKSAFKAIVKIVDEKPSTLKFLSELDLLPESNVKVESKGSFNVPLNIVVNGKRHEIEQKLAIHVHVKSVNIVG